jgi:NAD(P)-dependent dehydrogenase (short-subunit alcohol dehydrogenase family)
LTGKVAVVTGAASGIGRATAIRFAEEGAQLGLTDINAAGLDETVRLVKGAGGEVVSAAGDIGEPATIDRLVAETAQAFGKVNVLANIAGMMIGKPVEDYTVDDFNTLMRTNTLGPFLAIQRVVPEMRKAGIGSIVNVSSNGGMAGFQNGSLYCGSKAAVIGITRAVAVEVAEEIRCNAICPGAVDTPMPAKLLENFEDKEATQAAFLARQMLKRFAAPAEIANVIVFLASDESSFMTGTIVPVDAGWTAW